MVSAPIFSFAIAIPIHFFQKIAIEHVMAGVNVPLFRIST